MGQQQELSPVKTRGVYSLVFFSLWSLASALGTSFKAKIMPSGVIL